jgi:imidazoleglycerol-phosphate dehydratase
MVGFDLTIRATGDVEIDGHHLVEDLGIALGQALNEAVGDKRGIARYGFFIAPMDEVLMLAAVDFCGRAYLQLDWTLEQERLGEFDTFLAREFFVSLSSNAKMNLHLKMLTGRQRAPRHRSRHESSGEGDARGTDRFGR